MALFYGAGEMSVYRNGGHAVKIKDYIRLRKIAELRRAGGKVNKPQRKKKRKRGGR